MSSIDSSRRPMKGERPRSAAANLAVSVDQNRNPLRGTYSLTLEEKRPQFRDSCSGMGPAAPQIAGAAMRAAERQLEAVLALASVPVSPGHEVRASARHDWRRAAPQKRASASRTTLACATFRRISLTVSCEH